MREGGVYVHVPFCRNKCLYCDFYSGGERIADWEKFEKALLQELEERHMELKHQPETLYIGGGTPSLLPEENLERIVLGIQKIFGVQTWKEFTIEVNPEDVTSERCRAWKKIGVNRVSIGIQSLRDNELKKIGRRHTSQEAVQAISILKDYFENISVDLMFGLPEQTTESYINSLNQILDLSPAHISSYSLMLEEGTAMTLLAEKKKINLPDEEDWLKMFEQTAILLKEIGYKRYEISNYSLPGYESLHNSNYWKGKPYLGLGPSAHSYDGERIRKSNPGDLKGYLRRYCNEKEIKEKFYDEERLTTKELEEEMIMTRLRTVEGIDLEEFQNKFGEKEKSELFIKADKYLKNNTLQISGSYLHFTSQGFIISDIIMTDLI